MITKLGGGLTTLNTLSDLAAGGAYKFADGTAAAPSVAFNTDPDSGFYRAGVDEIGIALGGTRQFSFGSGGYLYGANVGSYLLMPTSGAVSLVASGTNQNITLTPSGTGWVQVGGTVNGQLRLYNSSGVEQTRLRADGNSSFIATGNLLLGTGTDSANGRLQMVAHSTIAGGIGYGTDVATFRYGTGSYAIEATSNIQVDIRENGTAYGRFSRSTDQFIINAIRGTGSMALQTNSVTALTIDNSQNLIGANNIFCATTGYFSVNGRMTLLATADGVVAIRNNAGTDFGRFCLGGTSASFVALRRNAAQLDVCNGDGSAYSPVNAASFVAQSAALVVGAGAISYGGTTATTVGAAGAASALPANPLGYVIINVAGTTAKMPYYNN